MCEPTVQIYVALLDEGVDVYRRVTATLIGPMIYKLSGPVPDDEKWAFQPGELVICEERWLSDGPKVVAVAPFGLR